MHIISNSQEVHLKVMQSSNNSDYATSTIYIHDTDTSIMIDRDNLLLCVKHKHFYLLFVEDDTTNYCMDPYQPMILFVYLLDIQKNKIIDQVSYPDMLASTEQFPIHIKDTTIEFKTRRKDIPKIALTVYEQGYDRFSLLYKLGLKKQRLRKYLEQSFIKK
ncbi:unnamed protein product [Commensalibacter communis]|uniref:hypothetical protein n=1 Tax=Commensalibacter communis TaxID=2972786 RepID=UPI0022FF76CE|nr:hypothetical protein [Commensalibacter communis]CAI3952821.1 unnamed protein product [Commensalibacter communis]